MYDSGLAELLGQEAVAARLIADLEDEKCRVARLTGGAGSGKSFIARRVADVWQKNGGNCIAAIGDDKQAWKELFPLLSGLAQTPPDWTGLAKTGGRSAVQIGETMVGGPGIGTSIFDLLSAGFRQPTERVLKPYSDLARDVVLDLKRLARRRPLLLVCDNAHWWDAESLQILVDVLSGSLCEVIPQLQGVSALIVDTAAEQQVVAQEAFDRVAVLATHTHQVHRGSSHAMTRRRPCRRRAEEPTMTRSGRSSGSAPCSMAPEWWAARRISSSTPSRYTVSFLIDSLTIARTRSPLTPKISPIALSVMGLPEPPGAARIFRISICLLVSADRISSGEKVRSASAAFVPRSQPRPPFCRDDAQDEACEAVLLFVGAHGGIRAGRTASSKPQRRQGAAALGPKAAINLGRPSNTGRGTTTVRASNLGGVNLDRRPAVIPSKLQPGRTIAGQLIVQDLAGEVSVYEVQLPPSIPVPKAFIAPEVQYLPGFGFAQFPFDLPP